MPHAEQALRGVKETSLAKPAAAVFKSPLRTGQLTQATRKHYVVSWICELLDCLPNGIF